MADKDAILRDLAVGRQALLRAVQGLEAGRMKEPGAEGSTWSAQDVLGHLAAWDRQTVQAITAYLAGAEPYHIAGFDNLEDRDRWNEEEVAQRRNWPVHETLVELGAVRSDLMVLLADLTEVQLHDRIQYPWGKHGELIHLLRAGADHESEHAATLAAWRGELRNARPAE